MVREILGRLGDLLVGVGGRLRALREPVRGEDQVARAYEDLAGMRGGVVELSPRAVDMLRRAETIRPPRDEHEEPAPLRGSAADRIRRARA